jgi:hypothetical protein
LLSIFPFGVRGAKLISAAIPYAKLVYGYLCLVSNKFINFNGVLRIINNDLIVVKINVRIKIISKLVTKYLAIILK